MTHQITNIAKATALTLVASAGMATAGGLDRSGQSVDVLFESGNYGELSFGYIDPSVTGADAATNPTGDMAPAYAVLGFGVKMQLSDQFALAVVYDQPYGADVSYGAGSFYAGTTATLSANAVTVLGKYNVTDRISAFGGAAFQTMSASAVLNAVLAPPGGYSVAADPASGAGFVVGGAYEIPDIALRVALTYRSEITTTHDTLEGGLLPGTMDVTTPQSVNLEFQTGINPKTLVFGSVRWVDWSTFHLSPSLVPNLVSYENDVMTYSLGVGRKITENLSAALTVGYERSTGGPATVLAPTDGNVSLGLGVTYNMGDAKVTAGVRHVWLGDATDEAGGTWSGNTAIAAGVSIGFEF